MLTLIFQLNALIQVHLVFSEKKQENKLKRLKKESYPGFT